MDQDTYWIISISFGALALFISLCSIILGIRNRTEQRRALLFSKKTEILTKLVEVRAKLNHLEMIYAQKLLFIRHMDLTQSLCEETDRIEKNLDLVAEKSSYAESNYNALIDIKPSDIEALERQIAAANSFILHAAEELEKEQKAFNDLRESVGQ